MIIINGTKYKSKICYEDLQFFLKDVKIHNNSKNVKIKIIENEIGNEIGRDLLFEIGRDCINIIDVFESENIIVIKVIWFFLKIIIIL